MNVAQLINKLRDKDLTETVTLDFLLKIISEEIEPLCVCGYCGDGSECR